ncbi:MAG: hypothetical protein M3076_19090 [Actinomycetota bacterium]|nr:hypothetical protein [Actinomycetota bacterium]
MADYGSMFIYIRSNIIALVALFVALGGTSYAAIALPAGSVGTKQLRNGAVTAAKVRKGSLLAKDFQSGQLPQGPQGSQGPQGPQGNPGPAGTARAYALVDSSGSFEPSVAHPGFTDVSSPAIGFYCLTPAAGISPAQSPAVATADWNLSPDGPSMALYRSTTVGSPICSPSQYEVVTYNMHASPPAVAAEAFAVIVP